MLAEWPAGTLESWFAYYRQEPWGDDWERTSIQTVEVINSIQSFAFGFSGGKGDPPEPIPSDALVPYREHKDQKLAEALQAVNALEGMRGL
jgi:hypothetical protein